MTYDEAPCEASYRSVCTTCMQRTFTRSAHMRVSLLLIPLATFVSPEFTIPVHLPPLLRVARAKRAGHNFTLRWGPA